MESVLSVDAALAQAVQHHGAGRLAEAEALYRAILGARSDHPQAHHNLGLIAVDCGKAELGLPHFRAAAEADPSFRLTLANVLLAMGRAGEAEAEYARVLARDPASPEANLAMGRILQDRDDRAGEAEAHCRRALAARPGFAEADMILGTLLQARGAVEEAESHYRRAIAAQPDLAAAHYNLGLALHAQTRREEAVAAFERAVAIRPDFLEALNYLGGMLWGLGRHAESLAAYDRALAIDPAFTKALHNKGNTLRDMGRVEDAMACFHAALAIDPDLPATLNSLGRALEDLGRTDEARASYERAVALAPRMSEAHNNLANVLMGQGHYDEAVAGYGRAVEVNPGAVDAHRNLLSAILFHPGWTLEQRFAEHRRFEAMHARPHYPAKVAFANSRDPGRRLRVAYLSSDFRSHSVGRNLLPLIRAHDRDRFELYFYAHVVRPDHTTDLFREQADGWRPVVGASDRQVAEMMRADGIDILVALAGRFDHNRPLVAAHRPAPVQISFHDPATSGLEVMDAIITDPVLTPRTGRERFTERPIRLPGFYLHAPMEDAPPVAPLPMLANGYPTLGSFNSPAKLSRDTLLLWAEVMRRIPESRLVLKYRNLMLSDTVTSRITATMAGQGIDPARIVLLGSRDDTAAHLALSGTIDIALDTLPFSGATTSFESLWMGVPVVTLPGETMLSRWTAAMLAPLGLTELIAASPRDYVDICEALCRSPERLSELRAGLRGRVAGSQLCNAAGKARHVERIYRSLWRRWCASASG